MRIPGFDEFVGESSARYDASDCAEALRDLERRNGDSMPWIGYSKWSPLSSAKVGDAMLGGFVRGAVVTSVTATEVHALGVGDGKTWVFRRNESAWLMPAADLQALTDKYFKS